MTFTTPMEETDKILKELEGKADVIIGIFHYGEDGEYDTEGMYEVAKKYADKVDAFFIGHSHSTLAKYLVNGDFTDDYSKVSNTVLLSTGTQGRNVGKISLTVENNGTGWQVADRKVSNISTKDYQEDEELVKALEEVHNSSVKTANTVVGKIGKNFYDDPFLLPGIPYAVIQDGALVDLINKVQLQLTGADVSLAALFDVNSNLQKGDYKKKDGVKVYKYDNTLIAVNITGKQLKTIMEEQAGKFFNQYQDGDVTISFNENIRLYNYDMFAGVEYQIDISKPVGQRIVNLKYKGKPLKDDQKLVLALNNYRYGGLSASGLISKDPKDVIYNSASTADVPAVRDMISEYVAVMAIQIPRTPT
jgi:2',3'-cyclic-nucleotide 2'-phosphodiesterase (5'-nucleotidase family)